MEISEPMHFWKAKDTNTNVYMAAILNFQNGRYETLKFEYLVF